MLGAQPPGGARVDLAEAMSLVDIPVSRSNRARGELQELTGLRLLLLGLVASLIALAAARARRWKRVPGANGRIAYVQQPEGEPDTELFTVEPDGSDARRLTNDAFSDRAPAWSADGERLVYSAVDSRGRSHVRVIEADGSLLAEVGRSRAPAGPAFSANGRRIVYSKGAKLVITRATGGRTRRLLRAEPKSTWFADPEYAPNGSGSHSAASRRARTGSGSGRSAETVMACVG